MWQVEGFSCFFTLSYLHITQLYSIPISITSVLLISLSSDGD